MTWRPRSTGDTSVDRIIIGQGNPLSFCGVEQAGCHSEVEEKPAWERASTRNTARSEGPSGVKAPIMTDTTREEVLIGGIREVTATFLEDGRDLAEAAEEILGAAVLLATVLHRTVWARSYGSIPRAASQCP
jgi:hypothetical protein